MSSFAFVII